MEYLVSTKSSGVPSMFKEIWISSFGFHCSPPKMCNIISLSCFTILMDEDLPKTGENKKMWFSTKEKQSLFAKFCWCCLLCFEEKCLFSFDDGVCRSSTAGGCGCVTLRSYGNEYDEDADDSDNIAFI